MSDPEAMRRHTVRLDVLLAVVACVLGLGACSRGAKPPARTSAIWVAAHAEPQFDPDGPPDALRAALERLLARGLVEMDSAGRVQPVLAERWQWSPDSLALTFTLRANLRFSDGSPLTSGDFAAALRAGLGREDHATRAWLLQALRGIDKVRVGRALPPLGIATPDARTLVLQLAHHDPRLLERLACPGVTTPWKRRAGIAWEQAIGAGPFRVAHHDPGRALLFVRADSMGVASALVDTLRVRFLIGAPRVRTLLRAGAADLVWPLPPALLAEALPAGWTLVKHPARPERRLLLVFRTDVPPTTQLAARHALAHAFERRELLDALGERAEPSQGWLPGAGAFDFPSFDLAESQRWREQGDLGVSFHVLLGYDADGAGAEVARALQGAWARSGLYAELEAWRGPRALQAPLAPLAPQALLVEAQAPLTGAEAELATLVLPLRGPAIGSFRGGWRTREFDRWVALPDAASPLDAVAAQGRITEERLALPLADLPWEWLEREGVMRVGYHPGFGPEYARLTSTSSRALNR